MPPSASRCPTSIFWCEPRGNKDTTTREHAQTCEARIQAADIWDMGLVVLTGLSKPCVHQKKGRWQKAGRLQAQDMPTGFTRAKWDSYAQGTSFGVMGPDLLCHPLPAITCSAGMEDHPEFTAWEARQLLPPLALIHLYPCFSRSSAG